MALFPVIDGQVQFDLSVPSGSIYRNGLRYSPDGAVFAALDGQISNYSQGIGLTADGAVVITGGAGIIGWQNGLPRDVESGAIFVTVGDALTYASGLPFTAQGALAISSDAPVPTIDFQFDGATMLDPRVSYTRGSEATGWVNGRLHTFGIDEPRFVTDPATGYSGLLLEPFSSTNLVHNSLRPLEWNWISNFDITPIQNIDGTMTAVRVETLSPATVTVGATYPGSGPLTITQITRPIHIDGVPLPSIGGLLRNDTQGINGGSGSYTIDSGAIAGNCVSGRHLGDGWYETVFVYPEETLPGPPVAGDQLRWYISSASAAAGIVREIAGLQIGPGTKATSFIPTGDSQATRAGDFFTLPVGDWYRPDRGTLLVEGMFMTGGGAASWLAALYQDTRNHIAIGRGFLDTSLPRESRVKYDNEFVSATAPGGTLPFDSNVISAIGWDGDGFVASMNGTVSDVATSPYPEPTELRLSVGTVGNWGTPAQTPSAIIRRVAYYPHRPTDAQLAALTEL